MKCYWMLQNAKFTAFTVSELLWGNQQGGKITPPPPTQTRVKKSFKSIDVDLAKHVLASNIN